MRARQKGARREDKEGLEEEEPPSNKFEYRCPLNLIEGVRQKFPFTLQKGCNLNILAGVTRRSRGVRGEGYREGYATTSPLLFSLFVYFASGHCAREANPTPNHQPRGHSIPLLK